MMYGKTTTSLSGRTGRMSGIGRSASRSVATSFSSNSAIVLCLLLLVRLDRNLDLLLAHVRHAGQNDLEQPVLHAGLGLVRVDRPGQREPTSRSCRSSAPCRRSACPRACGCAPSSVPRIMTTRPRIETLTSAASTPGSSTRMRMVWPSSSTSTFGSQEDAGGAALVGLDEGREEPVELALEPRELDDRPVELGGALHHDRSKPGDGRRETVAGVTSASSSVFRLPSSDSHEVTFVSDCRSGS